MYKVNSLLGKHYVMITFMPNIRTSAENTFCLDICYSGEVRSSSSNVDL